MKKCLLEIVYILDIVLIFTIFPVERYFSRLGSIKYQIDTCCVYWKKGEKGVLEIYQTYTCSVF